MVAQIVKDSKSDSIMFELVNNSNIIELEAKIITQNEMVDYYLKNKCYSNILSLQKFFPNGFNLAVGVSWFFVNKRKKIFMKELFMDIDTMIVKVANEISPDIFMYKAEDIRLHLEYEKLFKKDKRYELSFITENKDYLYYRRQ